MPKIYTKTGDSGQTSLFNGKRVSKSHILIEHLGELDLLNSYLGLISSLTKGKTQKYLKSIQSTIFEIGSEVAYPEKHGKLNLKKEILDIEKQIDEMEKKLSSIKNFILPGGSYVSAEIHITRALTRRVERIFVKNAKNYQNDSVNIYLNRLSDYLFVLARFLNLNKGIKDTIWQKAH